MRVLMTGATGLIGKEIGKDLVAKGHQVVIVTRNREKAALQLPYPAEIHEWEGHKSPFPAEALKDVEAVINLAGEGIADKRWTDERKREISESRIEGTHRLVEAIRHHGPKVKTLVSGSAIGYYGSRGDEVLTEESTAGEDFLANVVKGWEAEALALNDRRVAIVRTGVVFSRRGGALAKLIPIFSKGVGGRLGRGHQWMSWIHVKDIARVFMFCLENESTNGVYNGTAPEPAKNERFTVAFARALGRPVFLPVPESAIQTAMGEMSVAVLASQRVLPNRLLEAGFKFDFPEFVPALEEICKPLYKGMHEHVSEQWIPKSPEELFPFFCDEKNLEKLTPSFLDFEVTGKSTKEIQAGTMIHYKLGVHGVPLKWDTLIESWQPGEKFVDTQVRGPYRKWHHTHEFIPVAGGTLMRDRVAYQLPLGIFGDAVASWKVVGDVETIFDYRRKVIGDLFLNPSNSQSKKKSERRQPEVNA